MQALSAVDWILLAVLGLSFLLGIWRGIVQEVLSLAGWVAAFYVSQMYAPAAAAWLPMEGSSQMLRYAAGFVVVFVAVLVGTVLVSALIKKLISAVGLGPLDRLLGSLFGLMRGVVILLAVTVLVGMTPMRDTEAWKQAQGAQWLQQFLHVLKPVLPADFGKYLP
ncbi:MAG: colicin V synthesis protein [Burkholderiales bacterium 35-55-47]|jgi:membrane protein required for colicin V production|uniref:CvpA family protein n=1 Tax=Limnohabitans sp. TaxID=1907725 RepID=UPI000BCFF98C|nr:CvpA family protein [Limnohabitans sp.]OYY20001.1 MAG: colicin V synthesis protein [Burkholderiales bacterium 35-55-47]OYZ74389.1 MAG: colicin V synthesis protein [Burkholderiales bacterium 24-55-52]OZB01720.1 MAG: colicin V synthesis protein [Burkholderiales bacterium 39-55-53]HQR86222.1 CvpA family protein [Limnohabitans sp.]HQS25861.1 CvpA family protein [Limnohabitans sp.]